VSAPPDATERLLEIAATVQGGAGRSGSKISRGDRPVLQALEHALVKGIDEFISRTPRSPHRTRQPLAGHRRAADGRHERRRRPVRRGQDVPAQVVKSARVMKKAVAHLIPFMEKDKDGASARTAGRASHVKGDVHDIGKNIVGVVLQCNNFEVIDLGVMVHMDRILETAQRERADMIGLSGLITTVARRDGHTSRAK
jgi:5-methyltetrahydrofolate--homocysteine methyltransferase